MAKTKNVAWVVFCGRKTGVFLSWPDCETQVKGYPRNDCEGYKTIFDANWAWEHQSSRPPKSGRSSTIQKSLLSPKAGSGSSGRPLQDLGLHKLPGKYQDDMEPSLKRPSAVIDLTLSDDEESHQQRPTKKIRHTTSPNPADANSHISAQPVVLTPEQQAVVHLALQKHNIFLTGAAGSGKTVTLKEILRAFDERKVKYQVVAPTGIAALPLGGKTTYSFLGWKPDSLSKDIGRLKESAKQYVVEAVRAVDVLIVEEISMVENQILERMNLVLQYIRGNTSQFGGMQVIFLGDFHQLPPVKPFQFCLRCGRFMTKPPVYMCDQCSSKDDQYTFTDSDKWAFKAPVWEKLRLRMIQLQQIHRQKDGRFQDILNKIRHGIRLSDDEWHDLEKEKNLPSGIRAVRLMSLRRHVDETNHRELGIIKSPPRTWESFDSYRMVNRDRTWKHLPWEVEQPLKQHRLSNRLVLKVGAKVVLLTNLGGGLVNGSQGEVIDFQSPNLQMNDDKSKKRSETDQQQYLSFRAKNVESPKGELLEPVVRFSNGHTIAVTAITSTTRYGTNDAPYLASRTQVPLALAWALSIHKSQGMTLDYVEVSSRDIFERGQLYVALSRGTTLEGLIVTGTSREQLEVDSDVVEFYENTEWEDLSRPAQTRYLTPVTGRETIYLD